MDERRAVVALFGFVVALVTAFIAYRFIAALTVAVFLYYSTRPFYRALGRLWLPDRVRAVTVLLLLAVPLLLLLSYTLVLLVTETQQFIETYPIVETAANVPWLQGINRLPELTFAGIIEAYRAGQFDAIIDFLLENAAVLTSAITGFFLNLFIVVVVTYYLLIDGSSLRQWLEARFEDDAVAREYMEAADRELEAILFGNLLNVIAIALIAVGSFKAYNAFAPAAVEVPYPALAGVLTGVASLIPVVGMKIVYVPLAAAMAAPMVVDGEYALIGYLVAFLLIVIVVVDTIPDIILRPYLSGDQTHVGLLMLAYIFGPVVFGFYGLFLAPIILALGITFAYTALPPLLGGQEAERPRHLPTDQRRLDDFR